MSEIVVISGEQESGKSTFCLQVAQAAADRGLSVAGVSSPAWIDSGIKIGFDLIDLQSGERQSLAVEDEQPGLLRTSRYRFNQQVMDWGENLMLTAPASDLFILDELGPLELEQRKGWFNVMRTLGRGEMPDHRLALVVVRPRLLHIFARHVPIWRGEMLILPPEEGADPVAMILQKLL